MAKAQPGHSSLAIIERMVCDKSLLIANLSLVIRTGPAIIYVQYEFSWINKLLYNLLSKKVLKSFEISWDFLLIVIFKSESDEEKTLYVKVLGITN